MNPLPRVLFDIRGAVHGPTLVFTGGLHGNEPAGVVAAQRLGKLLEARRSALRGRVLALAGNRPALAERVRFVAHDLNRGWVDAVVARVRSRPVDSLVDEDREQRELLDVLLSLEAEGAPLIFVDLHTTSSASAPFVCFGDTPRNRRLALALPMTAILGLEETIEGTMLGYFADRGHTAIAIEAGQHDEPQTVDRHLSACWVCLAAASVLDRGEVPDLADHAARLAAASRQWPRVVEIRHRHVVAADDDFAMLPGFSSFQPIDKGQVVAVDQSGPVRAPEAGLMLMPRYQSQGEDGYFLVRTVAPLWLRVSDVLQRLPFDRVLPLLPGVTRHATEKDRLVVNPSITGRLAIDVMHLCGYRRRRNHGKRFVFTRRPGLPRSG